VAAVYVSGQFMKKIPLVWDALGAEVPEVMVRIADGDFRLQCRFRG
jgi:hypothetical protein